MDSVRIPNIIFNPLYESIVEDSLVSEEEEEEEVYMDLRSGKKKIAGKKQN